MTWFSEGEYDEHMQAWQGLVEENASFVCFLMCLYRAQWVETGSVIQSKYTDHMHTAPHLLVANHKPLWVYSYFLPIPGQSNTLGSDWYSYTPCGY